jgi:ABC-2 type transport system ATP-binding protein
MAYGVEALNLVKRYPVGGLFRPKRVVEALRGVTFRVERGTIYSLLGPNGAGKTTTIRILATLLEPDEGEARVAGYDVVREKWEVRRRIGALLSVERGFLWKLTARENLVYFAMIYGLRGRELRERVDYVLDLVGLKAMGAEGKLFEEMSLGMKARLGLARALLRDPEVLILDEPTLGLDPPSARYVRSLLRRLASQGKTVVLTTHNMFEAEIVSDKVGIIVGGRIVAEGAPSELKRRVSKRVPLRFKIKMLDERVEDSLIAKLEALVRSPFSVTARSEGYLTLKVVVDPGDEEVVVERVIRAAHEAGGRVIETRVEEPSLEDVFVLIAGRGE